ncbi:hypothetical protein ABTY61_32395 [Kitasatospora sp. NPDC096128]|uniref:hypothetical protein n=1 Tax=Kitasatospora sp. NPDC096128 TaxID=3155547 RepID=UPI00332C60AC
MDLRIELGAGRPVAIGRPTTGKTLGADATTHQATAVLGRALSEVERREGLPNTVDTGRYVVIVQDPAVLNAEQRSLADTINRRGAAVDVSVMTATDTPATGRARTP